MEREFKYSIGEGPAIEGLVWARDKDHAAHRVAVFFGFAPGSDEISIEETEDNLVREAQIRG